MVIVWARYGYNRCVLWLRLQQMRALVMVTIDTCSGYGYNRCVLRLNIRDVLCLKQMPVMVTVEARYGYSEYML